MLQKAETALPGGAATTGDTTEASSNLSVSISAVWPPPMPTPVSTYSTRIGKAPVPVSLG